MALRNVLFIDAYDSFSENIAALLTQVLEVEVAMIHIDSTDFGGCSFPEFVARFDAVVLGPGPGNPTLDKDVGLFSQVWQLSGAAIRPVLGICLGFQSLSLAFGACVVPLKLPCHGHAKTVVHCQRDIFAGLDDVTATNYNSLKVELGSMSEPAKFEPSTGCPDLLPLAWDKEGTLMAVKHAFLPYWGLQFHPESCKSSHSCHDLIRNWARECAKTCRPIISPPVEFLQPNVPATTSYAPLKSKLRELTADTSQPLRLSYQLGISSQTIADLCRGMSRNDCVMLESSRDRYSIYAFPSPIPWRLEYSVETSVCTLIQGERTSSFQVSLSDLFGEIHALLADHHTQATDVPFQGGFIGYFSYEAGLANLGVARYKTDNDISLLWVQRSIVFDHETQTVHVQSIHKDDGSWIQQMSTTMKTLKPTPEQPLSTLLASAEIKMPNETIYKSQTRQLKFYLYSGDSYELCLTTAAHITFPSNQPTHTPGTSYLLYRRLNSLNPAPYASYLALGSTSILSSSPEQFLTTSPLSHSLSMRPMKGTVRKTPGMTRARAHALLATPKEQAENLMIADLIRHDLYSALGRDARVTVPALCAVEEFTSVYQLTSHIRAEPHIPASCPQAQARKFMHLGHRTLKAALPPGSMTGAPKKRSCEILGRIEGEPRGVYSGVIGFLDVGGGGGFSVAIRSAVSEGENGWRVGAGGAITVLSDEEGEWREMLGKMESVLRAFRVDGEEQQRHNQEKEKEQEDEQGEA